MGDLLEEVEVLAKRLAQTIEKLPLTEKVQALNKTRNLLHQVSPFRNEPVDFVQWVLHTSVSSNGYNPNKVAPPEMKLLRHSIEVDGYTQPIVTWEQGVESREIVDGYHRSRVGQEDPQIHERLHGYLPVTQVNAGRTDKKDRIAATIRHNRARGKHVVALMSEIVQDLTKRNWSSEKIAQELGMDADEVLRLKQITGLAELFADCEFSQAWELSIDEP